MLKNRLINTALSTLFFGMTSVLATSSAFELLGLAFPPVLPLLGLTALIAAVVNSPLVMSEKTSGRLSGLFTSMFMGLINVATPNGIFMMVLLLPLGGSSGLPMADAAFGLACYGFSLIYACNKTVSTMGWSVEGLRKAFASKTSEASDTLSQNGTTTTAGVSSIPEFGKPQVLSTAQVKQPTPSKGDGPAAAPGFNS